MNPTTKPVVTVYRLESNDLQKLIPGDPPSPPKPIK